MKKRISFGAIVIAAICLTVAVYFYTTRQDGIRVGTVTVTQSGLLKTSRNSPWLLIVPVEKYPAELASVGIIDIEKNIYVARFKEPAGVGVSGFFDVCFKVEGNEVYRSYNMDAASIENIDPKEYITTSSYRFDAEKGGVLRLKSGSKTEDLLVFDDKMRKLSESILIQ